MTSMRARTKTASEQRLAAGYPTAAIGRKPVRRFCLSRRSGLVFKRLNGAPIAAVRHTAIKRTITEIHDVLSIVFWPGCREVSAHLVSRGPAVQEERLDSESRPGSGPIAARSETKDFHEAVHRSADAHIRELIVDELRGLADVWHPRSRLSAGPRLHCYALGTKGTQRPVLESSIQRKQIGPANSD